VGILSRVVIDWAALPVIAVASLVSGAMIESRHDLRGQPAFHLRRRLMDPTDLLLESKNMPRGDKSKYSDKQKRKAEHIADSYKERGVSTKQAKSRAWATVNKESGGGEKSGSGRGKAESHATSRKGGKKGGAASSSRSAAKRSASAKKAAATPKRKKASQG
jgi:plasmid stabilization system protein ParE